MELSVEGELQTCGEDILVQVVPKCSLVLDPPPHNIDVPVGETISIPFTLKNEGAEGAIFEIDKEVSIFEPEGLIVTEIKPLKITIPAGEPRTFTITVKGEIPSEIAYSVIVEGIYSCDGDKRPLKGTASVLVIE